MVYRMPLLAALVTEERATWLHASRVNQMLAVWLLQKYRLAANLRARGAVVVVIAI